MYKLIACLVAVAAVSFSAGETQAQFYRGGSGFSIGVGGGGFGYNNFNRGFGRSFSGVSISVGNRGFYPYGGFNRGFYGGGFPVYGRPVYYSRPVVVARPAYVPVYGGGFYRGNRGCGW